MAVNPLVVHAFFQILEHAGLGWLVARRTTAETQQQRAQGNRPQPRRLPDALLKITDTAKREERSKWLAKLSDFQRRQLDQFSEKALEGLLAEDDIAKRKELLKALLEKSVFEELRELKEKIEAKAPEFPDVAARLQRFGDWGRRHRKWF